MGAGRSSSPQNLFQDVTEPSDVLHNFLIYKGSVDAQDFILTNKRDKGQEEFFSGC